MAGSIIGAAVKRVEDPRFIRGQGTYVSNMQVAGAAHLACVRSEVPHGRIVDIDTAGVAEMPGVIGIYTAADLDIPDDGPDYDYLPTYTGRPILARDTVRFVGEIVVAVVAETAQQAADAAGAIWVDFDVLPSVEPCRPPSPTAQHWSGQSSAPTNWPTSRATASRTCSTAPITCSNIASTTSGSPRSLSNRAMPWRCPTATV